VCQKFRRHPLAIHHDAPEALQTSRLLIARENAWKPNLRC
jgi:hypothetical protein